MFLRSEKYARHENGKEEEEEATGSFRCHFSSSPPLASKSIESERRRHRPVFSPGCSPPSNMTTVSPVAMSLMLRMSGSFALRGLARATAAQRTGASASVVMSVTTTGKAPSSINRLFASLFGLPGVVRCYSGVKFVPGTDSDPEYSLEVSRRRRRKRRFNTSPVLHGLIKETERRRAGASHPLSFQKKKKRNQDYDIDALLASQQQPLAAWVLFRAFWK